MQNYFLLSITIAITLIALCSATTEYDVTNLCGQTIPVSDVTKESYVVHIPPHPPLAALCRVHLPEAIANFHLFVVRLVALDHLNSTRHDCSWLMINDTDGYPSSELYDLCNDYDHYLLIENYSFLEVNYSVGTSGARDGLRKGYDLIITPFHYANCDYMGKVGCVDVMGQREEDDCLLFLWESDDCGPRDASWCPVTCGLCTPPACADALGTCYNRVGWGWCEHVTTWRRNHMEQGCQYSCGFCQPNNTGSCCHYDELAGMEDEVTFHTCDTHRCLPMSVVCDGVPNCVDGSDELPGCTPYSTGLSSQPSVLVVILAALVTITRLHY